MWGGSRKGGRGRDRKHLEQRQRGFSPVTWLRFIIWRWVEQAKLRFTFHNLTQILALISEVPEWGRYEEATYEVAQGPGLNLKLARGFQSEESSFQSRGNVQQLRPHRGVESWPFLASTLAPTFLSSAPCHWRSRKQWQPLSWLEVCHTIINRVLCSAVRLRKSGTAHRQIWPLPACLL